MRVGVLEDAARELNPGFVRRMTAGRPYVRCKLAMSLDGRTAMASGESRWITGEDARRDVQRLRARSSAIVTGVETVLSDDPSLNVRLDPTALAGVTAGDELTLDFAKALIDKEQLGQDAVPDYLAVSFSSSDYVGHIFGASSLESEDNLARLDRTLAALLGHVDDTIGLENTLIVLSADHGQPEVPGHLRELGFEDARHFDTNALDKAPAIAALKAAGQQVIAVFVATKLNLPHWRATAELAVALGVKAIENGFSVSFFRLEELLAALRRDADIPPSRLRRPSPA